MSMTELVTAALPQEVYIIWLRSTGSSAIEVAHNEASKTPVIRNRKT